MEQEDLNDTHILISPKISSKDANKAKNALLDEPPMEEMELISEMGDDDRVHSSPNINESALVNMVSSSPSLKEIELDVEQTPDQVHNDDDDMEEKEDEFLPKMMDADSLNIGVAAHYDVASEIMSNPKLSNIRSNSSDHNLSNKPRKPPEPEQLPTLRARSISLSDQNISLLDGLRLGEMDVHIEICEESDLIDSLSVICRAMTLLPFGLMRFGNKLNFILQTRMAQSYELTQHFTFFLNSYRDCFAVSRLFKDSICMESIVEVQRLNTLITKPPGMHVKKVSIFSNFF